MLLGISELKARLLDGFAAFTLQPGYFHHEFNFPVAYRKCFESSPNLTELNDIAGFAIGTFDIIGMKRTVEDGFSSPKNVFVC